jgi:cysteinyl-tRNA synthetase
MFVCGPTVYDYSHVGHARTYLAYDIIARYLRSKGYSLFYVMNITDVEDKIINRARESGDDPLRLADRFSREFVKDMESLGISSVNLYAKASEHIPEIIAQVSTLIERGYAYEVDGDVYYDVSKFANYGKLSGQNIEQLTTHRIDPDPRKRSVVDFALWKRQKPGEPAWVSPWGKGRPGWHIEDTAITTTYFGPQYDLHGGGLDLVFPHHEAEIAQAEAATGFSPLVRYWIHGGLLMVSGTRMGKSMGNFITVKDALSRYDPEALRLYYAMSHYRSNLDYDESNVYQAEQVLDKLRSVHNQFRSLVSSTSVNANSEAAFAIERIISAAITSFENAMDEDFNTPRALAAMISFGKEVEPYATKNIGKRSMEAILQAFDYFGGVFGILGSTGNQENKALDGLLNLLMKMREEARERGDWATADNIRASLAELGFGLEDTPAGARWYIASPRTPARPS